jgi:hypothetical protein
MWHLEKRIPTLNFKSNSESLKKFLILQLETPEKERIFAEIIFFVV